jgi:hypothetical protein
MKHFKLCCCIISYDDLKDEKETELEMASKLEEKKNLPKNDSINKVSKDNLEILNEFNCDITPASSPESYIYAKVIDENHIKIPENNIVPSKNPDCTVVKQIEIKNKLCKFWYKKDISANQDKNQREANTNSIIVNDTTEEIIPDCNRITVLCNTPQELSPTNAEISKSNTPHELSHTNTEISKSNTPQELSHTNTEISKSNTPQELSPTNTEILSPITDSNSSLESLPILEIPKEIVPNTLTLEEVTDSPNIISKNNELNVPNNTPTNSPLSTPENSPKKVKISPNFSYLN